MSKKAKLPTKPAPATLSAAVRTSMLQIWRAGLGAFWQARQEGGTLFAKLARDGAKLQERGRDLACDSASGLARSAREIAGEVGRQASGPLRIAESRLERGMADALHTLGVPVRRDLHALIERVERLSATVEAIARERAAAAKALERSARKQAASVKKSKAKVKKGPPKALAKQRAAHTAAI